ncbi:MAG: C_GCAxxG_C_C family protein [Chloroflexi bacterium]|nr:C-GCAxxG-C-C family protein [Anaerolineaceae bacterium]NMB89372.1 C_GCAxxG_C_C family protein [Chloroflexota bacterium]
MDDTDMLLELRGQGFYCSQIILLLGLDLQGKENPDLVRAMNGLAGGLGFSGELCGALSGGACLLGMYAGKGVPEDEQNPRLDFMVMDLVKWFKQEYGQAYGGIRCADILAGNLSNRAARCPLIVAGVFQQVKELLVENGFDLGGME